MINIKCESLVKDNTINAIASFSGSIINTVGMNIYDSASNIFGGEYEYIPMVTSQILQCSQKKMLNNVTIYPIQTREVADSTGGVHFEILSGVEGDNYGI